MIEARADLAVTPFVLPPDAKVLSVSELGPRLRARIGPVDDGHSVVTRPGFRVAARLVPGPFAALISEFRTPSLLTEAIHRFARSAGLPPDAAALLVAELMAPERAVVPPALLASIVDVGRADARPDRRRAGVPRAPRRADPAA
jgi:hypothetical protein